MMKISQDLDAEPLPTPPGTLLKRLEALNICYKLYTHAPIFTVAEGEHLKADIPGEHCRNLFLRDKKKNYFLIVAANDTKIDLKKLHGLLGSGRLSFGSADRLWQALGIRPGSVNPFTVMNAADHDVTLILDKMMMEAQIVNYHPHDNAQTIGLAPADLLKFFDALHYPYTILDLTPAAP